MGASQNKNQEFYHLFFRYATEEGDLYFGVRPNSLMKINRQNQGFNLGPSSEDFYEGFETHRIRAEWQEFLAGNKTEEF